ncbi:APO protein 3 mitochondrial [Prunus yedoensis var. nudiflora]|uniref:APO protein 3 mitochondrial n=1 Tax=Prunus yedoensis var. nudiflora TaxID=2094558 RepID=A0A314YJF4_PRUYE|nr:APO protein 3 mitochondrial [Prunus yedoensis var. nudiflora]
MSERKPYPTPMKVLIQRAKEEKEARKAQPCRMLEEPPDNGLLVPELVEVAHQVYRARQSVLFGLSKLLQVVPVQRCRFCSEVHIGHAGHEIRTCTGPNSGFRSASHVWKKEEFKMWFPFLNASIFMIVLENQELGMTRGIESHGSLPFWSSVYRLV